MCILRNPAFRILTQMVEVKKHEGQYEARSHDISVINKAMSQMQMN